MPMLWVNGHYNVLFLPVRDRLYTSKSDVYRRQILTYDDGPLIEKVKDEVGFNTMSSYEQEQPRQAAVFRKWSASYLHFIRVFRRLMT